jgi:type II secretory pathway pseudopilin PulG
MKTVRHGLPARDPYSRGLTLVETVISLMIVGVMLVAALRTVGASRLSQYRISEYSLGQHLAHRLLVEILEQPYADPNGGAVFGLETGESAATRVDFDDIDDYDGWSASPPQDPNGSWIINDDTWAESVTICRVAANDPLDVQSSDTGAKRITVTITHDDRPVGVLTAIKTDTASMETGL